MIIEPLPTSETDNPLAIVVQREGLATAKASALLADFTPIYQQTVDVIQQAAGVIVTDATQVSEIKQSRALRLQLRAIRGEVESKRKEHKADALKEGRAIDAIAGHFTDYIAPVERRLAEQEQFAERKEAERKANLKAAREVLLHPFGVDTSFVSLADMPEATFQRLLESTRLADTARKEAAAKAEADRLAAIEAQRIEDARVRAENERLRLEAEAQARQLKQAQEAAETARRLAAEAAVEEKRKADAVLAAAEAKAENERRMAAMKAAHKRDEAEKKAAAELAKVAEVERKKREAVQAKLDSERKLREQAEAKERLRVEAERQRLADEAEAKRKAAAAPDREKLDRFARSLTEREWPEMDTAAGFAVMSEVTGRLKDLVDWIEQESRKL